MESRFGVMEGSEIFKFNDREEWCLIVDRFATGKGYLPLVTKSLKTGAFTVLNDTQFDMGVTKNATAALFRSRRRNISVCANDYDSQGVGEVL